jgi:hypothetical protein
VFPEVVTRQSFESLDTENAARLLRARFAALADAGCDIEDAVVIAVHPEVAIEDALDLLRRGCPASTALRIVL